MLARLFAPRQVEIESDKVIITGQSLDINVPDPSLVTINGAVITTSLTPIPLAIAPFGNAPNSGGASIDGALFKVQPANALFGGAVSTTTQSFGGNKTFGGNLAVNGAVNLTTVSGSPGGAPEALVINPANGLLGTQRAITYYPEVTSLFTPSLSDGAVITAMTVRNVSGQTQFPVTVSRMGNLVTLLFPQFGITGMTGAPFRLFLNELLPASYKPTNTIMVPCIMYETDDDYVDAFCEIGTNGGITFKKLPNLGFGITFGLFRDVTISYYVL